MVTASLEIFPTRQIKKTIDTSISELTLDGSEYDYLPIPIVQLLPLEHYVLTPDGEKIYGADELNTNQIIYTDETASISWSITDYRTSKSSSLFYSDNNGRYWNNIILNIPTVNESPATENKGIYNWEFTQSNIVGNDGQIIIREFPTGSEFLVKIVSNVYVNLSDTVESVIDTPISIQKRLYPVITSCTIHGTFKYLESQISIIDMIGENYELLSYIEGTGDIGTSFTNEPPHLIISDNDINRPYFVENPSVTVLNPYDFIREKKVTVLSELLM